LARISESYRQKTAPESAGRRDHPVAEQSSLDEQHAAIVAALRRVRDPELPLNIYDLGLIYRIEIDGAGDVVIDMTLTRASCPVAGMMPLLVKNAVGEVEGVGLIQVKMVWDPPWSQEHLSDEAKLALGVL
jgi:FeS assembly SUF system protein